jgi:hypothetical protein
MGNAERDPATVSFLTFWVMWARLQGWRVPLLHVRVCVWLETCTDPERVLLVFRGAAKSTIYAGYKAWKKYRDHAHRSLVWSADGPTAEMLTSDVINVLRNHPLTAPLLLGRKPGRKRFWINGAKDARNPSMRAVGVDSNATGARSDDVDFDDVEVPGNIETPEARAKLRYRISDSTHILVPGGQATYIGTPHTMDSIYPELIKGGAASLKIPLFEHVKRYKETSGDVRYDFPFDVQADGLYVLAGIHQGARMLVDGIDYVVRGRSIVFPKPPGVVIDICTGCAWPERFTRAEIEVRRRKTRTLNAWDSQYLLEAKPLTDIRLNPETIPLYECEPRFERQNKKLVCYLGKVRIIGAALRWDPSSGKTRSDTSALALVLQDENGCRFWHRAVALTGDVATFDDNGKIIVGGQVFQICDVVEKFGVRRIVVETNGAGTFAPAVLKAALKQRNLGSCGVAELHATEFKNRRVLEAFEPLMLSRMLWAHTSVADGPAFPQMKEWNPAIANQPDDHLDAGAGAITDQPQKLADSLRNRNADDREDWRPGASVFEAELEL